MIAATTFLLLSTLFAAETEWTVELQNGFRYPVETATRDGETWTFTFEGGRLQVPAAEVLRAMVLKAVGVPRVFVPRQRKRTAA